MICRLICGYKGGEGGGGIELEFYCDQINASSDSSSSSFLIM